MRSTKKPTKLTAVIYNNFVKVFNDTANAAECPERRAAIIAARKRFPTYAELLAKDLMYVDRPEFVDVNGNLRKAKTWIGTDATEPCDGVFDASFDQMDYMLATSIAAYGDVVVFKLRGTHSFDLGPEL